MKKRYLYPDIMRTAALLLIFVYHFLIEFSKRIPEVKLPKIFADGGSLSSHPVAVAVSLFFMVSGSSLMLSAREESALSFYRRRFRAIMIPFYIVFVLGFIGTLLVFPERYAGVPVWTILLSVIGMDGYLLEVIPNFYVTGEWFLGCLILLYLCFPFLKQCVDRKPVLTAAVTMVLFVLLLAFFHAPLFASRDRYFFLRLPEFMCGMYLTKYLSAKHRFIYGGIGLALCGLLFVSVLPEDWELLQRLLITAGIFLVCRCIGECLDGKVRFLEDIFHGFAAVSYEFFLLHHFLILLAAVFLSSRELHGGWQNWVLTGLLIIGLLAAAFLHSLPERVGKIMKKRKSA
ncbi:MAG: acyltransferase [Lachnospiraceae bacterium]|nr:acyltransferase [Lachnospiraceae bacterium]